MLYCIWSIAFSKCVADTHSLKTWRLFFFLFYICARLVGSSTLEDSGFWICTISNFREEKNQPAPWSFPNNVGRLIELSHFGDFHLLVSELQPDLNIFRPNMGTTVLLWASAPWIQTHFIIDGQAAFSKDLTAPVLVGNLGSCLPSLHKAAAGKGWPSRKHSISVTRQNVQRKHFYVSAISSLV